MSVAGTTTDQKVLTLEELAVRLRCGYGTAWKRVSVDRLFTRLRKAPGQRPGSKLFVPADEVEAWEAGGWEGLKRFRQRKGRR